MKILTASDLHLANNLDWLKQMKQQDFSDIKLVIFAGDLTDKYLTETEKLLYINENITAIQADKYAYKNQDNLWKQLVNVEFPRLFPNAQILVLPGNHDSEVSHSTCDRVQVLSAASGLLFLNIDNKKINVGYVSGNTYDYTNSGKCKKPYNNRMVSESEFYSECNIIANDKIDIFISHCPPHGQFGVTVNEDEIGSRALSFATETILQDCRYFIFGHNHNPKDNNVVLGFNSSKKPQTFINASIKRDDDGEFNRNYTIFDYSTKLSKNKQNKLFNRWNFWQRVISDYEYFYSQGPRTSFICPICGGCGIPNTSGLKEAGCKKCIRKNYLDNINELNFLDVEFELYNSIYDRMKSK